MHKALLALSETRRAILSFLKLRGGASISELAAHLGISDEGTRQHLIHLERSGWVIRRDARDPSGRSGRPASVYDISSHGEAFFPKQYGELALALMNAVSQVSGEATLGAALALIAGDKVRQWTPRLAGRSLGKKLDILKNYYRDDDEFASVTREGRPAIVERNCPFLHVASANPAICRMTVDVMSRLLGCEVRRTQTFQRGDGCCRFEVREDRPVGAPGAAFDAEPALSSKNDT